MEDAGDVILPDSLHLVRFEHRGEFFRVEILAQDRSFWIDADDLDIGILLLQVTADAADGPTGADAAHKIIDLPPGLFPDFRSGCFVMRLRVLGVVVLVGQYRIRSLPHNSFGHFGVAFRRFVRDRCGGNDDLGAKGPEQPDLFNAHLIRHGKDAFITLHCCGYREAKTRVSGGRLHNCPPRLQPPFAFRFFNHQGSYPVFH